MSDAAADRPSPEPGAAPCAVDWTPEAEERLRRAPLFLRSMVRRLAEKSTGHLGVLMLPDRGERLRQREALEVDLRDAAADYRDLDVDTPGVLVVPLSLGLRKERVPLLDRPVGGTPDDVARLVRPRSFELAVIARVVVRVQSGLTSREDAGRQDGIEGVREQPGDVHVVSIPRAVSGSARP